MAFGQDIADQGVNARTQQAMVNSLEYVTLEDQARSKYAHDINAALVASVADDVRDNAGDEPYQLDGYESSSTTSSDSLNLTRYTAKAEDAEDSDYEDAPAPEQPFGMGGCCQGPCFRGQTTAIRHSGTKTLGGYVC